MWATDQPIKNENSNNITFIYLILSLLNTHSGFYLIYASVLLPSAVIFN
jgi:hypothetical protein